MKTGGQGHFENEVIFLQSHEVEKHNRRKARRKTNEPAKPLTKLLTVRGEWLSRAKEFLDDDTS